MTGRTPRPGDPVELEITELDELGAGVARATVREAACRVHVAGALPGERVRARLAHLSGHAGGEAREAWAELDEVLSASPDRAAAVCPAHGSCGGCALGCLAYPAQLEQKRQRLARAVARHPELAGVPVEACVPSPRSAAYRNHAKWVYGKDRASGRPILGGFAPRSHEVVDLAGCRVVEPVLDEARAALLRGLVARGIEPFDERLRTGLLRYAVMRATEAGRVLVALVSARADWPEAAGLARDLAEACPAVAGVVLNVNPTSGNRILGDEERVLWGAPELEDVVGDARVRLVARSFFQANRAVAGRLYRDLVAAAPAGLGRTIDVYSGAGPIALSLAARAREVVAIEENPAATAAAARSFAELGGAAARIRMVTGDAAEGLAQVGDADLVVLDPPRKGCAPAVLLSVARLRPRLLAYVSCDPQTLARDLVALHALGGRLTRLTPYDMLPHTPHVEVLALVEFG